MRIAFLNPWNEAAETQAFWSLRVSAARIGHELILCANSSDIDACSPDFVLVTAPIQAKLNDFPHYGIIHAPLDNYFTNRSYFNNLLSYDGYLALADTLHRMLRDVTFGTGRPRPVGFYFNTFHRSGIATDLKSLIERRALTITYFGTNWDKRHSFIFTRLSEADGVQFCGPAKAWEQINQRAYGGMLPWDGASVQERYAANGIGLCMLSENHLHSDVISSRIFEVTAVGAIAFCCDTPWIRKHFGDSVYYFNQNLAGEALVAAILKLREAVYSDPPTAIQKAAHARSIFESKFASEILLGNVVRYHEELSASRSAMLKAAERYVPRISVILRCGSRSIGYVQRAVASIAKQVYGRFEVILVRHHDLDLGPVLDSCNPRIDSFHVVDCPGGNRSATLWAGLNAVTGEYFSILDDDDWWFSDHFEKLFHPLPQQPLRKFLSYSGSIVVRPEPVPVGHGGNDHRELLKFGIQSLESWATAVSAFSSNSFVASCDLLTPRLKISPDMETAEDSYLILSLMAQAEPRFSYAATSVFDRSLPGQSNFAGHPKRFQDELTLQLRLFGVDRPRFLPLNTWASIARHWKLGSFVDAFQANTGSETLLQDWEQVGAGYDPGTSHVAAGSSLIDPQIGSAAIHTPPEPWQYAVMLTLPKPSREAASYAFAVELHVREGKVGVGILRPGESEFLFREAQRSHPEPKTVLIPVRNLSEVGQLVIQNWDTFGASVADLISIRLMAAPAL
ncbi:MAG TPA: glycosyltransferase family A protein [Bryobacteraceae bacterium]|nr:glycosyltransferase family A protein [Bryobacteraceae bacterium]